MKLETLIGRLANAIGDAIIITDAGARPGPLIVWCNAAFTTQTGYSLDEVRGRSPRMLQGPGTDPEMAARLRIAIDTWSPVRGQLLNYRKDGFPFWVDLSLTPIADDTGWFHYWVGVQRDMTELVQLKQDLQGANRMAVQAQQRLWDAIEAIPEGFVIYDADDRLLAFNRRYLQLYADSAPALQIGARFEEIVRFGLARGQYPEAVGQEEDWFRRRLRNHHAPSGPIEQELPGDRHLRIHEVRTPNGDTVGFRMDVTELKRQKRQLAANAEALARAKQDAERAAYTDPLTGLGNRRALDDKLSWLAGSAIPDALVSILHVDLDHFKSINDAFGHPAGDHVIRHIARVLTECARPSDLIARVGGDEFVLVLISPSQRELARSVADRIIARCREPIRFGDKELHIGASIGLATGAPPDAASLLNDADIALYEAKRVGRNRSAVFTPRLRALAEKRKRIADELVKALADDDIVPFFQPQVSADTKEFVGVEALVRWRHRTEGLVSPGVFLPVAEDLGLMSEIDEIILAKSLGMVERLKAGGVCVPKISVNVSYRRLADSNLGCQLGHAAHWPCRVAFELLETIDFDRGSDELVFILDDLRERGVEIEIDDFGSGRASITTLLKIRPKRIKIDQQLVGVVESDLPRESPILRAIGQMGRSLGIAMTAEGVETEMQARVLRRIGCDVLQGFLYCAAIPESDLCRWIVERPDLSRVTSRSA
jgi:diguanylate cyclase (GGDEF)-like protein/PAS domain S-box-containing protein